jgi:mono/diheme cytochrome c family protein
MVLCLSLSFSLRAQELDSGKKIYKTSCLACHGKTGAGDSRMAKILNVEPILLDLTQGLVLQKPDSELLSIVSDGLTMMPAFKNLYSQEQIQSAVLYIRALQLDARTKKTPAKKKRSNP